MVNDINDLDLNKSYTYADYITWQFTEMVELIKGKIFNMSPAPKRVHQDVSSFIHRDISIFLKKKPCKVYAAPFDVRFVKESDNGVITTVTQPDICVICDQSKLDEAGCLGAPDFIIEILSPSTKSKDIHEKYDIYEEYGVKEYWIVDPSNQIVDKFVLENDKYQFRGKYTTGDIVSVHTLPGLEIDLNEIFEV